MVDCGCADRKGDAASRGSLRNNHMEPLPTCGKAGVTNDRLGTGAIADYDNDGWRISLSPMWARTASINNHDGTFTDVAEKAGVQLVMVQRSTWGDYDGDGRLDLFVAGYIHWTETTCRAARRRAATRLLHLPRRAGSLRAERIEGRA